MEFGVSSTDYIKAFNKVVVGVKSSEVFKPNTADSVVSTESPFSMENLLLAFQADKSIKADINGNLTLPFMHSKQTSPSRQT